MLLRTRMVLTRLVLTRLVLTRLVLVVLALAIPAAGALAQGFPSKTVKITLGLPAGSGPDGIARLIADRLSKDWDRAVIVENRPGGSGVIAMEAVRRAAADGHELILADGGDLAINRHAFKKLPYDPVKDFEPVVLVMRATFFLIVPTGSPFQSVGDLIAYARANPGKLSYGSFGVAHTTRLTMESFLAAAGIEVTHVPFRDAGQLIAAASNGDVQLIMNSAASARPGLDTGRLRLLAVASRVRLPSHPNVPTVAESGGPDTEAIVWVGLVGPRGMPKDAVAKVNAGVRKALEDKIIQDRLAVAGLAPAGGTPEDFAAFIRAEDERYGKLVRTLKIQLD